MKNIFQNTAGERCLFLLKVAGGIITGTESLNTYKHKDLKNSSPLIFSLVAVLTFWKCWHSFYQEFLHLCHILWMIVFCRFNLGNTFAKIVPNGHLWSCFFNYSGTTPTSPGHVRRIWTTEIAVARFAVSHSSSRQYGFSNLKVEEIFWFTSPKPGHADVLPAGSCFG